MRVNVLGRVRNTYLPKSQPLLPLFEAVVNSIHSIEDLGEQEGRIVVSIERDFTQDGLKIGEEIQFPIRSVTIEDNGQGFDSKNFESFETADSSLKQAKGSKGVGRFIWLKAFEEVHVESNFYETTEYKIRKFTFEMSEEGIRDHIITNSEQKARLTRVCLKNIKHDFRESFPKNAISIAGKLLEHLLIYFITGNAPEIFVIDGPEEYNLNKMFKEKFADRIDRLSVRHRNLQFRVDYLKASDLQDGKHSLSLCAHGREVKTFRLEKYGADFSKRFEEGGKTFILLVYLSGEYLDFNVNQERTNFNIPETKSEHYDFTSVEDIIEMGLKSIKEFAKPYTDAVQAERYVTIENYVVSKAPEYRVLLNDRNREFIDSVPITANEERLDTELHKAMRRLEDRVKEAGKTFLKTKTIRSIEESVEYKEKYVSFIEDLNEIGKSKLVNYIVHRRSILELFENSLQRDDDGKFLLEANIHKIIHPLIATSEEVSMFQQNLWIIDERLNYHIYLASDLPFSKLKTIEVESKKEPDIIASYYFDAPHLFTDAKYSHSSIVMVEFKRPGRDDYNDDENPISQVEEYIDLIREERAQDKNGRMISASEVPIYCYIICDITPTMRKKIRRSDFTATIDGKGFFTYNKNLKAYIEILSFEKVLEDANRRNHLLFKLLNIK